MLLLGIIFAAQMIVLLIALMFLEYKRTHEMLTPWTIFLGMAVIDVFLPGLLFLCFGMLKQPEWREPLEDEGLIAALLVFTASILCFAGGYFYCARRGWRTHVSQSRPVVHATALNLRLVYLALCVSGTWYLWTLLVNVSTAGSFSAYLTNMLITRWKPEATEFSNIYEFVFTRVGSSMMTVFLTIVGMLFFYRKTYHHEVLWGVVLPCVGWLFTLTTFFRGSQLAYCVALVAVETIRLKSLPRARIPKQPRETIRGLLAGNYRKILGLTLLGILLFVAYGTARNYYSSQVGDAVGISTTESVRFEGERFIRGESLISLASIMAFYPQKGDYLYGKTLLDMSLLFIPRYLWASKPEWYGIDDITRGMGWAETTQNAVTMPGELYANFGLVGIPLMAGFGAIFGGFYTYRYDPHFRFVYAFVFLPCMLVVFWMSYTGLINSLAHVPIIWCTIVFLQRQRVLRSSGAASASGRWLALSRRRQPFSQRDCGGGAHAVPCDKAGG